MYNVYFPIIIIIDEAESAQPHPQQCANPPASIEAYPMQSPPSYNVLYTAKAPNPQAVEVSQLQVLIRILHCVSMYYV